MNINLKRYYDAIGISGWNKKTFLNKSRRKMLDCFWRMFAKQEVENGAFAPFLIQHKIKRRNILWQIIIAHLEQIILR